MGLHFWECVRQARARAEAAGTLLPLRGRPRLLQDPQHGAPEPLRCAVFVVENLADKPSAPCDDASADPFVPPFPEGIEVMAWGQEHRILLNRFPLLRDHVLLVTRRALPQAALLRPEDVRAGWMLLQRAGGLLFYNAGTEAGASQPHRHLQLVRTPLVPELPELPDVPLEDDVAAGRLPGAVLWSRAPQDAQQAVRCFETLAARLGLRDGIPYNWLATRRLWWMVRRRAECFEGISVNALGFAGLFAVPDEGGWQRLRRAGPRRILSAVADAAPEHG